MEREEGQEKVQQERMRMFGGKRERETQDKSDARRDNDKIERLETYLGIFTWTVMRHWACQTSRYIICAANWLRNGRFFVRQMPLYILRTSVLCPVGALHGPVLCGRPGTVPGTLVIGRARHSIANVGFFVEHAPSSFPFVNPLLSKTRYHVQTRAIRTAQPVTSPEGSIHSDWLQSAFSISSFTHRQKQNQNEGRRTFRCVMDLGEKMPQLFSILLRNTTLNGRYLSGVVTVQSTGIRENPG